ncbi:MAG: class I SAM-dependent methyltransferase [Candidatus Hodarchaeales archaeon]|jgi:2-polyprenyl-3-methyl-5-hydroxy-6-metoxy-1,4-benzoquinol methylase
MKRLDDEGNWTKHLRYQVQVEKNHYSPEKYLTIKRWITHSNIVKEVLERNPRTILEIGPGNGLITSILKKIGFNVKTLDFEKDLKPDYLLDIASNSLGSLGESFDLIIASQVLEHIRYESFLKVMNNLNKITSQVLLTLPDTNRRSKFIYFLSNKVNLSKKILYYKRAEHTFDGQHYWEIGKKGFSFNKIRKDLRKTNWYIKKNYLIPENPYHRLLFLTKLESH